MLQSHEYEHEIAIEIAEEFLSSSQLKGIPELNSLRGSQASVFLADGFGEPPFIIKFMADEPQALEQEIVIHQYLSQCALPVPPILATGQCQGIPYFIMT